MARYREPVAVMRSENGRYDIVYCNDGSVWEFDQEAGKWHQRPQSLPGSIAEQGFQPPYGD